MASKPIVVTKSGLSLYDSLIKSHISKEDAKSIKGVLYNKDTHEIYFYKKENPVEGDTPDFTVDVTTDISGLLEKITSGVKDNMVMIGEDGTVVDSGIPCSSVVKRNELETVETKLGDISKLNTTAKTDIVGAINEVLTAVGTGGTASVVSITTDVTSEGALKSYTIKQGTTTIGTIDIPKDLVVTSGSVVTDPEGETAGTYIKLVIANQEAPLYINVGNLVDIYIAKKNATQIQIAINASTREISATIVAGSVGTTELSDDAVTTVKIADANVTLAKLAADVTAAFDAAGSAATAETNAKTHANTLNSAMDTRMTAVEGKIGDGFEEVTEADIRAMFGITETA